MTLLSEFKHALTDGLGSAESKQYEVSLLADKANAAIAFAGEKNHLWLLLLPGGYFPGLTGDEYLEAAKVINKKLGAFVSPGQPIGGHIVWSAKTYERGPVYAYRFTVYNEPTKQL
jgi:hypothetical protein